MLQLPTFMCADTVAEPSRTRNGCKTAVTIPALKCFPAASWAADRKSTVIANRILEYSCCPLGIDGDRLLRLQRVGASSKSR